QQAHGGDKDPDRPFWILGGPVGKEAWLVAEIARAGEPGLQGDERTKDEKEEPQGRRHIGPDPGEEMEPADPMKPARGKDAGMLQVALAPSAVTKGEVGE